MVMVRESMVRVKVFVVAVAVLLSVTRTVMAEDPAVVGVPEITPVDEFNESPATKVPFVIEKLLPPDPPVAESDNEKRVP